MSVRNRLRSLLTLVVLNGLIPIRTQPLYIVNLLASPLSFLFFIYIVSGGHLLLYGVIGGMILTMLSVGTSLQSDLTHYRHDLKFQDVVVASPVEAPTYIAGMALSELVYSLPALAVFVAMFVYEGWATPFAIAVMTGVLLLMWGFASAFAFTLATYFQDVRETFLFSPILSLVLTVLPPVYYPISALPGWAQIAARFSPTTYAAGLAQGAVGLAPLSLATGVLDWGVLGAFTAALFLIAAFKARWQDP
ncbi:MAG TPA: ABC transporter permease [Thermoplasmata archaeon]|nr:ABC transporter permease [Thermoplasmata archaeon]